MEAGISIVICCFNSSPRLQPTLEHLISQTNIHPSQWEVIVVDNGATDDTSEKALSIWNKAEVAKPEFKVVFEGTPGLTSARQKGISESKFNYVLFCDDDNWLDENYISIALEIMQRSPDIGVLGGIGSPTFEDKEPPYFWINQYNVLAVGIQSEKEGDITSEPGVVYGAGMILNKIAYNILIEKYKFQFQVSDRIRGSLLSHGDHELCLALKRIGYTIHYSEKLSFQHYIPKDRTSINYYKQLFFAFGRSYAMLQCYFIDYNKMYSFTNDYRYICFRCLKNILIIELRLIFKGYYFSSNKYKFLSLLQLRYGNAGTLSTMLQVKNLYIEKIKNSPLFKI